MSLRLSEERKFLEVIRQHEGAGGRRREEEGGGGGRRREEEGGGGGRRREEEGGGSCTGL